MPTPSTSSLVGRLISRKAAMMLGRNTVVSCCTFAAGLALLWLLVAHMGVDKVPAAAGSFLLATTLHYVFGRTWIFAGTQRGVASGYGYFIINAGFGMAVTTILFAAMIKFTSINYLVARAMVSVIAGLLMFLLNAVLNFRRL